MWDHRGPSETTWEHVRPCETKWDQVRPSETKWDHARPCETKWDQLRPIETNWNQVSESDASSTWVPSSPQPPCQPKAGLMSIYIYIIYIYIYISTSCIYIYIHYIYIYIWITGHPQWCKKQKKKCEPVYMLVWSEGEQDDVKHRAVLLRQPVSLSCFLKHSETVAFSHHMPRKGHVGRLSGS